MDRTATCYALGQASEVSGLSPALLWSVCDRMGVSPDAVPSGLVHECRYLVGAVVDAMVNRCREGVHAGEEVRHG